ESLANIETAELEAQVPEETPQKLASIPGSVANVAMCDTYPLLAVASDTGFVNVYELKSEEFLCNYSYSYSATSIIWPDAKEKQDIDKKEKQDIDKKEEKQDIDKKEEKQDIDKKEEKQDIDKKEEKQDIDKKEEKQDIDKKEEKQDIDKKEEKQDIDNKEKTRY
ncbi:hypothetical protein TNIN_438151, partial [Trichonephila inaurata madagascariensis]